MVLFAFDMREKVIKTLSRAEYSCYGDILDSSYAESPSDYVGWKPIIPDSTGWGMYNKIKEALAR